jgi:hypothetical protein
MEAANPECLGVFFIFASMNTNGEINAAEKIKGARFVKTG